MAESTTVIIQNLLERLQVGEEGAREELVAAAQKRLDELARSMLKRFGRVNRWESTSDVRQNASLRLWRSLSDVSPESAAGFFRLAATHIRRELIDLARHYFGPEGLGANQKSAVRDHPSPVVPECSADEDEARIIAEWTEFHEQVERLPDEERAAYDLLWYQELPQAEAARVLGISVWTLRRHYRNAKLRLHDWLDKDD